MKRAVALLAVIIASVAGGLHAATPVAAATPCTGRCLTVTIPLPQGVKVTSNKVEVLLPTGYYSNTTTRYPVVYMLCGAAGNQTEWRTSSDLSAFTANLKAIFVMPDCGGAVNEPGWYSNWANGKYQWESYYINVLIPWINAHGRTLPNKNAIVGLSMGGYGAVELAERHPSLFAAVGTFSGYLDNQYGQPVTDGVVSKDVWGDPQTDAANWASHNPINNTAALRGKDLFIACGTGGDDPDVTSSKSPSDLSYYGGKIAEENLMFQTHVPFLKALNDNNISYHSDFYPGGSHRWTYFQAAAHWALPQIVADLNAK